MTAAFRATSGSLALPSITFNSDTGSGLYLPATGAVGLVARSFGLVVNSNVLRALSATIQTGGTNYAIGDTITLTGGSPISGLNPVATVLTLTGTAVATVSMTYAGFYTVVPTNPVSQGSTSGTGTGCTLNVTFTTAGTSSTILTEANNALFQRLGASSFVSSLMPMANGVDFVTAIGASNVATAIGISAPPPGSSFKNLAIKVTSNTTLTATADFIVTTTGTRYLTTALSSTINMGTTGANALDTGTIAAATWYAIWAIAQPNGTTAGLASLSASAPTMPSGYTYKSRIGWVRTAAGSAQLLGTFQFGRRAQYVMGLAQTTTDISIGAITNTGLWQSFSTANMVPATASEIIVTLFGQGNGGGGSQFTAVAPNGNYSTVSNGPPTPPVGMGFNATFAIFQRLSANILLETVNIFGISSQMASSSIICNGWTDNL